MIREEITIQSGLIVSGEYYPLPCGGAWALHLQSSSQLVESPHGVDEPNVPMATAFRTIKIKMRQGKWA